MAELRRRGVSGPDVANRTGISRSMTYKWAYYDIKKIHSNNVRILCDTFHLKAKFLDNGIVDFTFTESYKFIDIIERQVNDTIEKYSKENESEKLTRTWIHAQEKVKLIKEIVHSLLRISNEKLLVLNEFLKEK